MYEDFFEMRERPFDLTANPRFLFLSSGHREALSTLQYGIDSNKGVTALIGEAGTGKTTLIRAVLEQQRVSNTSVVYLNNPTLSRAEFYDYLAHGFGLSRAAAVSKTTFLRELEGVLRTRAHAGGQSALIVDEAQSLPHDLLEEIRLIANLETATSKLLAVVLAGQPELAERLNEPGLRQLKQRVALRCMLSPFDLRETAAYVAKRIRIAGGDSVSVFTRDAVELIHRGSRGIARSISVVCDNALITGFALQQRPVDADIVLDVCRDFDLAVTAPVRLTPVNPAAVPSAQARSHAGVAPDAQTEPRSQADRHAPSDRQALPPNVSPMRPVPAERRDLPLRGTEGAEPAEEPEVPQEVERRRRFLFF
jgi:general secretion pathway protein A